MKARAKLPRRDVQYSSRTSLKSAGRSLKRWLIALASRVAVSTPDDDTSKDLSLERMIFFDTDQMTIVKFNRGTVLSIGNNVCKCSCRKF